MLFLSLAGGGGGRYSLHCSNIFKASLFPDKSSSDIVYRLHQFLCFLVQNNMVYFEIL